MLKYSYKLDEHHNIIAVDDIIEWAQWFETADRIVEQTQIAPNVRVSTVFLGLDHNLGGEPLLFETMVFGGTMDEQTERYPTWDDAVAGHKRICEEVQSAESPQWN